MSEIIDKIKKRLSVDPDDILNENVHWFITPSDLTDGLLSRYAEKNPGRLNVRLTTKGGKNTMLNVANELHKHLFGTRRPRSVFRYHGCDNRCVNPYHLYEPNKAPERVAVPTDDYDLTPLLEEISVQVGAYGLTPQQIHEKYHDIYTPEEIDECLKKL